MPLTLPDLLGSNRTRQARSRARSAVFPGFGMGSPEVAGMAEVLGDPGYAAHAAQPYIGGTPAMAARAAASIAAKQQEAATNQQASEALQAGQEPLFGGRRRGVAANYAVGRAFAPNGMDISEVDPQTYVQKINARLEDAKTDTALFLRPSMGPMVGPASPEAAARWAARGIRGSSDLPGGDARTGSQRPVMAADYVAPRFAAEHPEEAARIRDNNMLGGRSASDRLADYQQRIRENQAAQRGALPPAQRAMLVMQKAQGQRPDVLQAVAQSRLSQGQQVDPGLAMAMLGQRNPEAAAFYGAAKEKADAERQAFAPDTLDAYARGQGLQSYLANPSTVNPQKSVMDTILGRTTETSGPLGAYERTRQALPPGLVAPFEQAVNTGDESLIRQFVQNIPGIAPEDVEALVALAKATNPGWFGWNKPRDKPIRADAAKNPQDVSTGTGLRLQQPSFMP